MIEILKPGPRKVAQMSEDWERLHLGRVTASSAKSIITEGLAVKKGDRVQTFLEEKLTEWFFDEPLDGFGSYYTEQGILKEPAAIARFKLETGLDVEKCGFYVGEDGRCGCSPDGLVGDDAGLEIKCPARKTHIGYLLAGGLPVDYAPQVHFSIYVTGRSHWWFMSYCRFAPVLLVKVERDEKVMATIKTALEGFYERFDKAAKQLKEMK